MRSAPAGLFVVKTNRAETHWLWLNESRMEFGTGPTLRESCKWLQDDDERHRRILDVTERNSVIGGFRRFGKQLAAKSC